jgi:hypothetical protein
MPILVPVIGRLAKNLKENYEIIEQPVPAAAARR